MHLFSMMTSLLWRHLAIEHSRSVYYFLHQFTIVFPAWRRKKRQLALYINRVRLSVNVQHTEREACTSHEWNEFANNISVVELSGLEYSLNSVRYRLNWLLAVTPPTALLLGANCYCQGRGYFSFSPSLPGSALSSRNSVIIPILCILRSLWYIHLYSPNTW